jgi:hypothetical protein
MKFRLVEDAISSVRSRNREQESILDEISIILNGMGFETDKSFNGHSFHNTYSDKDSEYDCQFYLDLDNHTYSSYISSVEDSNKSVSFQQNGPIKDATDAVMKFVNFIESL